MEGVLNMIEEEDGPLDSLAAELEDKMILKLDGSEWEEAGKDLQYAILLKLASNRPIKKRVMVDILGKVWKLSGPVTFHLVESNVLLVKFENAEDQNKVLAGGPWSYEGTAIIMQKWEAGMVAEDFTNTKINISVQLHKLPFELRTDRFARKVAEQAGRIVANEQNGILRKAKNGGEFMAYRVELDVTKSVRPGIFLQRKDRNPIWVAFRYVKLPNICFNCGRLNHEVKQCEEKRGNQEKKYGIWLRAEAEMEHMPKWPDFQDLWRRERQGGGGVGSEIGSEMTLEHERTKDGEARKEGETSDPAVHHPKAKRTTNILNKEKVSPPKLYHQDTQNLASNMGLGGTNEGIRPKTDQTYKGKEAVTFKRRAGLVLGPGK